MSRAELLRIERDHLKLKAAILEANNKVLREELERLYRRAAREAARRPGP